ncbi:queuosine precursor transporter [Geoglobus acetivorans]|uniref:Probable queuosine precursor transporter n=1 Tax=Geoglobus acetivorans TaxID=565033 RepID=A0ABZ3H0F8_GEOAI|nr:queuosine precursor transporter [Geoglobus acetivorans]
MLSNEVLWFILLMVSFALITLVYRLFGRAGLYVWIGMAIILANIQVAKLIEFFGLMTAMGNIIYGSTFLATDILAEKYGKKYARKGVFIGFFVLIATTIIMQITLAFTPAPEDALDPALQQIFGFMPDVTIASLTAYLISQLHDVWAFHFWKEKTKGRFLWLRNNASTLVSQLIDNATFTLLFFVVFNPELFAELGWQGIWEIFITSYIMKFVVALMDTPFIYLATRIKPEED